MEFPVFGAHGLANSHRHGEEGNAISAKCGYSELLFGKIF